MRLRSHMQRASVVALQSCVLLSSVLCTTPGHSRFATGTDVRLSTIPRRVFVDNDGIVEPWPTETFVFFVVLEDESNPPVERSVEARIELLSKGEAVQTMELPRRALQSLHGVRFKTPPIALSGWSQHRLRHRPRPYLRLRANGGRRRGYSAGGPVFAPADGVVVLARNDVPDQPRPGVVDRKSYETLPDARSVLTGNTVVIDHGQGEYSALSHFQRGSGRVVAGQRVRRGDQIGRIGNSGSSELPHLHYQLMEGPDLFRSDGLPPRFINVWIEAFTTEVMRVPKAKRGIPLTAR